MIPLSSAPVAPPFLVRGPTVALPRLPDVSVIIPTYGEAANLPLLVPRLMQALSFAGIDAEIIVVDDNSPDDTWAVCQELAVRYPLQLLVRRGQRGLASAVVAGMKQAAGARLLVMDADLSHPPEKAPELVAALDDRAVDFVMGSRYLPGAAIDEGWSWWRWLNSRVATLLARPLTAVRDPLSGFFALRKTAFDQAAALDAIGYKIGLELMVKTNARRVREIPIHFRDRQHGQSKMSATEQVNYLRHLCRLYAFTLRRK